MTPQPVESRVDGLENRVTQLEQQLGPDDRDLSQVVPLRTELRAEFSSVRAEIAEQGKALRSEIAEQGNALGAQMRVLHEDVISRIALLQEGLPAPRGKSRKKP
jgi:hypothetical protein